MLYDFYNNCIDKFNHFSLPTDSHDYGAKL